MPAPASRRRRVIGQRRRVEDEGDDEGGREALDLDDDSLTDGTLATDDRDAAEDSDTSNIDEASPTSPPNARKSANGTAKKSAGHHADSPQADPGKSKAISDTEMMLHGLSINDQPTPPQEMHFDDVGDVDVPPRQQSPSAPIVVSSASALRPPPGDRRRQEHEDYKKKRAEDPAFVPNRGAFFMHDHRHAGPAANGFRPFGRGRGRGGRGGIGGPFAPINSQIYRPVDPTTNSPWTHDMHEAVVEAIPRRSRQTAAQEGPANGTGFIPTRESNTEPINRTLSTEKHIGNAQVRVMLLDMKTPTILPGLAVKQYTKLPDHRPPLRRDKPVRISIPNNPPRYVFPAIDRSFIFIPRAMRPNQQRGRGKPRSGLGSAGGFSRRTSVFGGSYYGSVYSPSVAPSRRSSFVHDRDYMFSPTESVMSRPPLPSDSSRPVVRLPPGGPRADGFPAGPMGQPMRMENSVSQDASLSDLPQPQTHPLPHKPVMMENRQASIPMHQPRPQKNISVADIEPPSLPQGQTPFQQAFHQQVPVGVSNGWQQDAHARHPSYQSHHSMGTPLSHIPERAIHAAPFQPHVYGSQPFYQHQAPQHQQQSYQPPPAQPGYYYGQGYSGPGMGAPPGGAPFAAAPGQQGMTANFTAQGQSQLPHLAADNQAGQASGSNLVAQEVNGMVYYYDAAQLPQGNNYSSYSSPQTFQPGAVGGMAGPVAPSPDGYYYPQPGPGMVYYPQ